ncbi:hypothetical protein NJT12_04875 [Flavobacterium sp. AC]|uniref:Single-stranded DNA-binding protein n=1 Tax=Flavobacterium azizsancarii TaxID=2961580 RepID=A0ABT4W9Z6_9FLAO|nr:hypothetical protein [Flavobacterium azizsancarii]MDA6068950.1 hypothetical protein [Flavobacterium azizsancarii]
MRKELEKLKTIRMTFTAKVGRFGTKKSYHGYSEPTICLCNIKDSDGNQLTDHIWFTVGKTIEKLKLEINEVIKFDARVNGYRKGYFKDGFDYKLNNISKIERVS